MARLAVGFVDLVGFTPLSRHLAPRDLVSLVTHFEARAFDIVSACDGRIVKHIGDEVMYSALSADAAAHVALALVDEHTEGVQPRGGFCYGEVLTLRGDYYGRVVNLAARLIDQAVPGEVLVDGETAELLAEVPTSPVAGGYSRASTSPSRYRVWSPEKPAADPDAAELRLSSFRPVLARGHALRYPSITS